MPKVLPRQKGKPNVKQTLEDDGGITSEYKDAAGQSIKIFKSPQTLAREAVIKENLSRTTNNPLALSADEAAARQGLPFNATERAAELQRQEALKQEEVQMTQENRLSKQRIMDIQAGDLSSIIPQTQVKTQTGAVDEYGNPTVKGSAIPENQAAINKNILDANLIGAGVATGAAIGSAVALTPQLAAGFGMVTPQTAAATATGASIKSIASWVGVLGTLGFGIGSFSNAMTSAKRAELKKDIYSQAAAAKQWAVLGKDSPDLALQMIDLQEAKAIQLLGELHLRIKEDPRAVLKGEDIEEDAVLVLSQIQRYREAVQKYYLKGDSSQIDTLQFEALQNGN